MIDFFQNVQEDSMTYLIVVLSLILTASTIDFTFGWVNAKFNSNIVFVSGKALYGIVKKIMYFVSLVFFMIVAFTFVPMEVAFPSVIVLSGGYLVSEINSILSHLGLTEDGKEDELFKTFVERIFNNFMKK